MGLLNKDDIQINLIITIPDNVLSEKGNGLARGYIEKNIKIFGNEMKEKILNLLEGVQ